MTIDGQETRVHRGNGKTITAIYIDDLETGR